MFSGVEKILSIPIRFIQFVTHDWRDIGKDLFQLKFFTQDDIQSSYHFKFACIPVVVLVDVVVVIAGCARLESWKRLHI